MEKISQNQARDHAVLHALHSKGWRCLTVWECSIRGSNRLEFSQVIDTVEAWLRGRNENIEICGKHML